MVVVVVVVVPVRARGEELRSFEHGPGKINPLLLQDGQQGGLEVCVVVVGTLRG